MIKTALKKKECPYCREKILKNEETGEEDIENIESELEELVVNENYAVEVNVEVEIIGNMDFSEDGDSDSDYEPENNNSDLTIIAFNKIGYITYSYLKEIVEISIYKYLFYKNHHVDYLNKFKNCDFELFKEIPLLFGYSIESNDNEKRKVYNLFFKDSNDVYAFATSGSEFEQDKNIGQEKKKKNKSRKNIIKLEEELLNKKINEIKSIEHKVKKNKSKKNKEKVNKNRCLKF
jgi:hypothetical protein